MIRERQRFCILGATVLLTVALIVITASLCRPRISRQGLLFPWGAFNNSHLSQYFNQDTNKQHKKVVLILSQRCDFCKALQQCYFRNNLFARFPGIDYIFIYRDEGLPLDKDLVLPANAQVYRSSRIPEVLGGGYPQVIFLDHSNVICYDRVGLRTDSTEMELLREFAQK